MPQIKDVSVEVPGVTTYGVPGPTGGRASSFTLAACEVLVRPGVDTDTEKAFELACELARARKIKAMLEDEITTLRAEVRTLKAKVQPPPPARLLGPGFVRFDSRGLWLLANRERGFGEFGFRLSSWDQLFREYAVSVVEHGTDEHGQFWRVENQRKES